MSISASVDVTQPGGRRPVPVRTIVVAIALVLATAAVLLIGWAVARVLVWIVVSVFFAVVLSPLVDLVQRRLHLRRALAAALVFLVVFAALGGIVAAVVVPTAREVGTLVQEAPRYVEDARNGRGPVGELIQRYHVDTYVQEHQEEIEAYVRRAGRPAASVLSAIFGTVVGALTVFFMTFLMLLDGPRLLRTLADALPDQRRQRVTRVASDCARSVTGYMTGNLAISLVAGVLTYVALLILGVPYRGVAALLVGVFDLIPLIGATLGAIVAVGVAALHSWVAALVMVVFFVLYQQFENHALQPLVMSRTVKLRPLIVFVSVLIGAELAGIFGALVAIPVAGIVQVIGRDVYDHRRGEVKPFPTTGEGAEGAA